jgi:hypothetical protein
MPIIAPGSVVDPVAVTHMQAGLRAVPPNGTLHEPGKLRWQRSVELPRIDVGSDKPDDRRTPSWPVAARAVRMVGGKPPQDSGSVQKIMDQGVDGD